MKKIIICMFLIGFYANAFAQKTDYKSYALYLYSFVKYTQWTNNDSKELNITVLGKSKILEELQMMAGTQKISGKKVSINQIDKISDIQNCHLLFITDSKSSLLKEIINSTKNKSILLVAEREGLAKKGACISFAISEDENLAFEVNKRSVENQKLKIADRLLDLGMVINP